MLWLALVGLTDHLVHNRIKGGCTASQQAACGGGLLMAGPLGGLFPQQAAAGAPIS